MFKLTPESKADHRECVHLVTRGHFRSRDKDYCNTIWSAVWEDPMPRANFTYLCSIKRELLPIEVSPCGNKNFRPFWLLWPWPRSLFPEDISFVRKIVHAFESYHLTDRQTDRTEIIHQAALWAVRSGTAEFTLRARRFIVDSLVLCVLWLSWLLVRFSAHVISRHIISLSYFFFYQLWMKTLCE